MEYDEIVSVLVAERKRRTEIDHKIKKLEREVLETKTARDAIAPILNQGGERTENGVTFEIKRSYLWDQALLQGALETQREYIPFVSHKLEIKVNLTQFKSFCLDHPGHPIIPKIHAAMSTKFGSPRIKAIKEKESA